MLLFARQDAAGIVAGLGEFGVRRGGYVRGRKPVLVGRRDHDKTHWRRCWALILGFTSACVADYTETVFSGDIGQRTW